MCCSYLYDESLKMIICTPLQHNYSNQMKIWVWRFVKNASSSVASDKNITCTFETDLCNWDFHSTAPADIFTWTRLRGVDLSNQGLPGPSVDHLESNEAYFIHVSSKVDMPDDPDPFKTYFTSPYFVGYDHPIECLSFWFSLEVRVKLTECVTDLD